MAAGVTMTGLTEFKAGVEQLPRAVTLKLRAVAWRMSRRVWASAKRRLESQTHGTGQTARALHVVEHEAVKAFSVEVGPVPQRPDNVALWLELGTVKMTARPFLRPAIEEHAPAYIREAEQAIEDIGDTLK